MTWYMRTYDIVEDLDFQCEVSEETAIKARAVGAEVQDHPFPGVEIASRYRSEREKARNTSDVTSLDIVYEYPSKRARPIT